MMWVWLAIAGGVGCLLRYGLTSSFTICLWSAPACGTFVVNVLGCLIFGVLYALFERQYIPFEYRSVLLTGLLGGFTTMSSFAGEALLLFERAYYVQGFLYVLATNVFSVLAAWLGIVSIQTLMK